GADRSAKIQAVEQKAASKMRTAALSAAVLWGVLWFTFETFRGLITPAQSIIATSEDMAPVRYEIAREAGRGLGPGGSIPACLTTVAYANGAQGIPVYTPCSV